MKNQVVELLQERHATRAIDPKPLPEKVVSELIEAVRLTPSCFNNQPWRFLFFQTAEARAAATQVLSGGNKPWAGRAPLLALGYARAADDCVLPDGRKYFQFDVGMAAMNLMLAATARGLVARPMAGFDPAKAKEAFQLPEDAEPLIMLAVGLPSNDESGLPDHAKGKGALPRERKPATEIVKQISFRPTEERP